MSGMLSVTIITFNEENNIASCISSVNGIADEIIVVDCGSSDKTVDIATDLGATVHIHPFKGHIQQKNHAASLASHDYILSVDADEVLSDRLKKSITDIQWSNAGMAYSFNRLNYYCGKPIKHGAWYPDVKTRLFRKDKGNWGGMNPHDRVVLEPNIITVHLNGDLLHYTVNSKEEFIRQTKKFSKIGAIELLDFGQKSTLMLPSLRGTFRFIRDYIFKFGFLDGKAGYDIASIAAKGTYWKYSTLKNLIKDKAMKNSYHTLHCSFGSTEICFEQALNCLPKLLPNRRFILLSDEKILGLYPVSIPETEIIVIPEGDQAKNLACYQSVIEKLIALEVNKSDILVGFGGGSICDFTGFVSSTYKRGIESVLVPTTLLAQVDAGIGGKTALNFSDFKNMIGTFHAPSHILIDASYLQTLSSKVYREGFAEVVKHALIKDNSLGEFLIEHADALLMRNDEILQECVRKAAMTKINVVEKDDKDQGLRKILNFGHTIGHAIERTYNLSHGDAVFIGMEYATSLSNSLGHLNDQDKSEAIDLIRTYNSAKNVDIDFAEVARFISNDKKRIGHDIDYVLLKGIGESIIQRMNLEEFLDVMRKLP